MKRKLVVLGGSLFVSLPTKYIKENNLKKGQEVDIELEGNRLMVVPETADIESTYRIDIKDCPDTGGRYIVSAFRLGYDNLIVDFRDPGYISQIPIELAENTIGFEIIKQEPASCTIKNLTFAKEDDLNELVKRIWFLMLDMAKDMGEAFRKGDKELLKNMYAREKNINKFTNYCLRMLLQNKMLDHKYSHLMYYFIRYFENISDDLENLATGVADIRPDQGLIDNYAKAVRVLENFYQLFYSFRLENSERLLADLDKLTAKVKVLEVPGSMELYNLLKRVKRAVSVVLELSILKQ